jgi:hypothetical protein
MRLIVLCLVCLALLAVASLASGGVGSDVPAGHIERN